MDVFIVYLPATDWLTAGAAWQMLAWTPPGPGACPPRFDFQGKELLVGPVAVVAQLEDVAAAGIDGFRLLDLQLLAAPFMYQMVFFNSCTEGSL